MQYLLAQNFLDIKAGGFNYGLLKVGDRKPLNNLIGYYKIKNKPTHISGSFLGKICIRKTLMEDFPTNLTL